MVTRSEDIIPLKTCRLGREEKGAWDNLLGLAEFRDLGLEEGITTWSNKQSDPSTILKRLNICYLVNLPVEGRNLEFKLDLSKSLSDHYPICLKIGEKVEERRAGSRYRLDPKWLDLNCCQMVINPIWNLDNG